MNSKHEMPFGAEVREDGTVRFRLWAPKAKTVELLPSDSSSVVASAPAVAMTALDGGWFETISVEARAGSHYQFRIDGQHAVPDPASRWQAVDVHGASAVVDPAGYLWHDSHWRGRPWAEAVTYELHVGAFSPEGTYAGAEAKLDHLAELGVTAIELMPLSSCAGERNWGYDGVLPFAPARAYGEPNELKRFIDAAHARNLMVFLDVVYNHFGPEGNYLWLYAPQFFTDRHHTPWGQAINFDGPDSRPVRDFFIHNALYWLEEYRFDGLRLDAVHAILDDSSPHILDELAATIRRRFAGQRAVHLMLENERNEARYLKPSDLGKASGSEGGGAGGNGHEEQGFDGPSFDAQWNDDFHHALQVLLTGEKHAFFSDYAHDPIRHLGRCLAEGFGYQGEASEFRGGAARGEPSRELPASAFVCFLQNHDQIGNRACGERLGELCAPAALKAALAIMLLAPSPPLLFMGEEFAASTPFLFFCDFGDELAAKVRAGRRAEFAHFAEFDLPQAQKQIPDPISEETFLRSKLDWSSLRQSRHREWLGFYRALLACRRNEFVTLFKEIATGQATYEALSPHAVRVRWPFRREGALELVANLGGSTVQMESAPRGRLLHGHTYYPPMGQDVLGPFAVAWFLNA